MARKKVAKEDPFEDLGAVADSLTTTCEHLQDYVGNEGLVSPRAFEALKRYAIRLEASVNRAISNKSGERRAKSDAALLARINKRRALQGLDPLDALPLE